MDKRTIALVSSPEEAAAAKKVKITLTPLKDEICENDGNLLNTAINHDDIDDSWFDDDNNSYLQDLLAVSQLYF